VDDRAWERRKSGKSELWKARKMKPSLGQQEEGGAKRPKRANRKKGGQSALKGPPEKKADSRENTALFRVSRRKVDLRVLFSEIIFPF
jgi:hypothetical protein